MGDRHFTFEIAGIDSGNFAYVGARITGAAAGSFAIVGLDWTGDLPDGVVALPPSRTPAVLILGRTLVDGDIDLSAVTALQDQYSLTPLDLWGTGQTAPEDRSVWPAQDEQQNVHSHRQCVPPPTTGDERAHYPGQLRVAFPGHGDRMMTFIGHRNRGGRSPVDRGKQGTKRSVACDNQGIPLHLVAARANDHDSPLREPTLAGIVDMIGPLPQHRGVHGRICARPYIWTAATTPARPATWSRSSGSMVRSRSRVSRPRSRPDGAGRSSAHIRG